MKKATFIRSRFKGLTGNVVLTVDDGGEPAYLVQVPEYGCIVAMQNQLRIEEAPPEKSAR